MTNSQPDTIRHNQHNDEEEDKNIDLGALIATILNGKYLIIFFTLIFFALGVFNALLIIPSYKADAMVQIEEKSNALDALATIPTIIGTTPSVMKEI